MILELLRQGWTVRGRLALSVLAGIGAAASAVALTGASAWLISRAARAAADPGPDGRDRVGPRLRRVAGCAALRGAAAVARRVAADPGRAPGADVPTPRTPRARRTRRTIAPATCCRGSWPTSMAWSTCGRGWSCRSRSRPSSAPAPSILVLALVPLAGATLAVTLLVAAVGAPLAGWDVARRAEARIAPARGALSAAALDLLQAAPELVAAGVADRELSRLAARSGELERAEARSAAGAGIGVLVASLSSGAAVWLALVAGVAAVRSGAIGGVALAVVVLLPIAAHELVGGLAPVAQQVTRLRAGADRLAAVLGRPDPVADPDGSPCRCRPARTACGSATSTPATRPDGRDVLRGVSLDLAAGGAGTRDRTQRIGQDHARGGPAALPRSVGRLGRAGHADRRGRPARAWPATTSGRSWACARRTPTCSTRRSRRTSASHVPAPPKTISAGRSPRRTCSTGSTTLPDGLDTFVGEAGARLSGGQRQRLELARSILADRPILVFDEPTEHLDEATAAALTADLLAAAVGRTRSSSRTARS